MPVDLTILYRGPLTSCNYACDYCPFAKRHETAAELRADHEALERFVSWCRTHVDRRLRILFTPWGEGLARRWYREALVELSHLPHVERVAAQTNLSCELDWTNQADRSRLALWCTFHPSQVTRAEFLVKCRQLDEGGVRHSVGMVGLREHFQELSLLRRELPDKTYVWINAYRDIPDYYREAEVEWLSTVDPWFRDNLRSYASLGETCLAGESAISVDGDGTIRRCHFIREPIGNLYHDDGLRCLRPRPCSQPRCDCYIGYVHLPLAGQRRIFGDTILERIPARWPLESSVGDHHDRRGQ